MKPEYALFGLGCLMALMALLCAPPAPEVARYAPRDAVGAGIVWREGRALIDVNTADHLLLEELAGLGEVLAARVVRDREENGLYRDLSELARVRGIGGAKIAALSSRAAAVWP